MEDEEKKQGKESQEQEDQQQSPLNNASQVTDQAKKVGEKTAQTLRGLAGVAGGGTEAAGGAAATTEAAAGVTAEAGAAATEGTSAILATASSNLGGYAAIAVIILVLITTILLALFGNGQTVVAGTPPPPPPGSSTCANVGGQCKLSCDTTTETENADPLDCSTTNNKCCISQTPPTSGFHFYCQYDSTWSPKACDISYYGCAPTSLAMILTSLGDTFTPTQVGQINNMGCNEGTSNEQIKAALYNWVRPKGYNIQPLQPSNGQINPSIIKQFTDRNFYVLAGACLLVSHSYNDSLFGPLGHAVIITGVNSDGTLKAMDPTFCSSDKNYRIRTLVPKYPGPDVKSGCVGRFGAWGGWTYAYAIKLKTNGQ